MNVVFMLISSNVHCRFHRHKYLHAWGKNRMHSILSSQCICPNNKLQQIATTHPQSLALPLWRFIVLHLHRLLRRVTSLVAGCYGSTEVGALKPLEIIINLISWNRSFWPETCKTNLSVLVRPRFGLCAVSVRLTGHINYSQRPRPVKKFSGTI